MTVSAGAALPPDVVAALRRHLPEVVDEVVTSIGRDVPRYRRPLEGHFGQGVRRGVEVALGRFLAQPGTPTSALSPAEREVYVDLGRGELLQGRPLEALLAAYRVGARVAFRRFAALARAAGMDADLVVPLAEATFAYIDELSAASIEGYAEEQSRRAGERDRLRAELLGLLLLGTADSATVVTAAAAASWDLPDDVVLVAVPADRSEGLQLRLGPEALVGVHGPAAVALLAADRASRGALSGLLQGRPAAVSPAAPWAALPKSLRLALLGLAVAADGPLFVDDRLADLVLHRDPELLSELVRRALAPLQGARPSSRDRLAQTLLSWLAHRGERQHVAAELHVHPQTVAYRMGQLRELFGPALDDPQSRFALEMALRGAGVAPYAVSRARGAAAAGSAPPAANGR